MKKPREANMSQSQQKEQIIQVELVTQIPLEHLTPDVTNRKIGGYDQKKLEQLAESIKAVGVQQPAVVRRKPEYIAGDKLRYEIVAGARRWRASKLAGLETMPCVVRDLDDVTVLKIRTIENLQREDVHPLDEADGFAQLLEKGVYDPEHLAAEVGKSISYVYQRIKLRELIAPARKLVVEGKLSAGHAILIARLQSDQQKEVLEQYLCRFGEEGPSVRDLDDFIRNNILMDLSKTSFRKDDADLVPKAGSCATCQKRTGAQPALFADVCKKDYCGDKSCFQAKLNALIVRRQGELAGETHLLVREGYGSDKDIPGFIRETKGVLDRYDWQECKAKDEGAVRCLVVDGVGRGRLTWGKKREQHHYQPSPQEKAAAEKKKRELEAKRAGRRKVWDEVFKVLPVMAGKELPLGMLRIIVFRAWEKLWHDHRGLFAKTEGWEKPVKKQGDYSDGRETQGQAVIAKLDRIGLLVFLTKITLIHSLDVQPQYGPQHEGNTLHEVAAMLGLDPKDIEAKARKEAAEQKKPAAKGKTKTKARKAAKS